jgi:hypothetical protein
MAAAGQSGSFIDGPFFGKYKKKAENIRRRK